MRQRYTLNLLVMTPAEWSSPLHGMHVQANLIDDKLPFVVTLVLYCCVMHTCTAVDAKAMNPLPTRQ